MDDVANVNRVVGMLGVIYGNEKVGDNLPIALLHHVFHYIIVVIDIMVRDAAHIVVLGVKGCRREGKKDGKNSCFHIIFVL